MAVSAVVMVLALVVGRAWFVRVEGGLTHDDDDEGGAALRWSLTWSLRLWAAR